MTPLPHWPRLLNGRMAAAYCGVSESTFRAVCPVKPVRLGKTIGKERAIRWDKQDIDRWLDSKGAPAQHDASYWAEAVNGDQGARR